jgi:hypothetical protein
MPFVFPYTSVQLTEKVNRVPNLYGLINTLNIFPSVGSISTLVRIQRENGVLAVLPAKERGAPASVGERKRGDTLFFEIPHFPHIDKIGPDDIQGVLTQVAAADQPTTFDLELAKLLIAIRNKHAITREWLRMSALKGLLLDGDGATVYDLFAEFGVTKKTVHFDLDDDDTDIEAKCNELIQHIQTNLLGEVASGVRAIVSTRFFDKFTSHKRVRELYLATIRALDLANTQRVAEGGQLGRRFRHQQVEFVEYIGVAPVKNKTTGVLEAKAFVEAGKGHAYPMGTMSTFATYDAPPNHLERVNRPGLEVFISPKVLDHGEGVELKSESNPLPICKRPEVLVEIDAGADPG